MNDKSEPKWLSAEQQQAWRHYLRASRQLELALDRDLLMHGMSLAEYELLSMLSEAPEKRLRMSELAERVVQSRSRITHTASRLENRGWVERQPAPGDKRGVVLVLTDGGMEALLDAAPVHVDGVRKYFIDAMPARQLTSVGKGMKRIHERVDADMAAVPSANAR